MLINSKNIIIKGLDNYGHNFCIQHTQIIAAFFFKNKKSVIQTFKILDKFSFFSGLKPDNNKFEVTTIAVKKAVQIAICGTKNIDLKKKTLKFLGVCYFSNKKLENEENLQNYTQNNRDCFENLVDD